MTVSGWLSNNYIEVFGAIAGIIYVFLEIRQTIWLWPVGIITSAVYIWVFFTSKFYADMSLQGYYLVISCLGWYWWAGRKNGRGGEEEKGRQRDLKTEGLRDSETGRLSDGEKRRKGEGEKGIMGEREKGRRGDGEKTELHVTRLILRTGIVLSVVFVVLFFIMNFILSRWTDSPVPGWDSFLTSLSIVATWMLARKIYEHWLLWIVVNSVSAVLFLTRGLYPTVILYMVYGIMSFAGLAAWEKTIKLE